MSNGALTKYFQEVGYKPTYHIGDRVRGRFNGIPISGSVGNDNLVNEDEGPKISVFLDLPIMVDGVQRQIIFVKHKDIHLTSEDDSCRSS